MRVLQFIVDGNVIKQDPDCDFTGLFPGKEDRIRAEFTFSKDWQKRVKVAAFWSVMGTEFEPQEIKDGESCMIPVEALRKVAFGVQVFGKYRGVKVETNKVMVYQSGGKR